MHEYECRTAQCEYIDENGWCRDCDVAAQNVSTCGIVDNFYESIEEITMKEVKRVKNKHGIKDWDI